MIEWLKRNALSGLMVTLVAVVSFLAGQVFPSYFDHAKQMRDKTSAVIAAMEERGDALESALPPLIDVAAAKEQVDSAGALSALSARMLELFQALEYVSTEFPESEPEHQRYVASLVELRQAASRMSGPLDASQFIEAASAFKHAREQYESKVAELEPSFIGSVLRNAR